MEEDFFENRIDHIKKSIECIQKSNGNSNLLKEAQEFLEELEILRDLKKE